LKVSVQSRTGQRGDDPIRTHQTPRSLETPKPPIAQCLKQSHFKVSIQSPAPRDFYSVVAGRGTTIPPQGCRNGGVWESGYALSRWLDAAGTGQTRTRVCASPSGSNGIAARRYPWAALRFARGYFLQAFQAGGVMSWTRLPGFTEARLRLMPFAGAPVTPHDKRGSARWFSATCTSNVTRIASPPRNETRWATRPSYA